MSDELGTYSFLPWLRLGLANKITAADEDPTITTRATMAVSLEVSGRAVGGGADLTTTVTRDVALYGPGDVIGIDPRAIVKKEPRDHITNFEPNYLPFIEFYEEDFPWRYTPAAPDGVLHRLRPWLALVVLTDTEFDDASPGPGQPLAAIDVQAPTETVFPPADQLWAWAHVHANRDLIQADGVVTSADGATAGSRLETAIKQNADHAYSRILCPRRLEPDTGYHAFLVPSFESGRLAGLGLDPNAANPERFATQSAWASYTGRPVSGVYPYYTRWYFKTGTVGDFEYLVRLLQPRHPDSRLGRRDMDVQRPGSNLTGIEIPELGGVLRLGGALQVPAEALTDLEEQEATAYEEWDDPFPHPFQKDLADFINLADDYQHAGDPDPLITPPLYGRWHALSERILSDPAGDPLSPTDDWLHEVNLDPRFRVAAGFGTQAIERNQEEYMDAAWAQVGDVIAANRRIRLAQVAASASAVWHTAHLRPLRDLSAERALAFTAPLHRRVVTEGLVVRHRLSAGRVPTALLSAPVRRILRPRDHVAATLGFDTPRGAEGLFERVNSGEVSAAPDRATPPALPTTQGLSDEVGWQTAGGPLGALLRLLARRPWVIWALWAVLLLVALLVGIVAWQAGLAIAAGAALLAWRIIEVSRRRDAAAGAVLPGGSAPEVVDALPHFPDFTIADPDDPAQDPRPGAGPDSAEARRFKRALTDTHRLLSTSATLGTRAPRRPVDLAALTDATVVGLDPTVTIPAFTMDGITLPLRIVALNLEVFREAMVYPEFDIPMYAPLLDLPGDNFLPNIDKIPPNTITLLETNQRFIEAYMLGVNVAMASELLWREYPTDQRGSYFRQFWDPSAATDREGLSKEELREKLRDIPPIHTWSRFSHLGDHDHRERPGETGEEAVLVIRGELLKKYPTAVIYAQRARWQRTDGEIDTSKPREFETAGPEEDRLKTPLYEAKADPDITFLGFDLKVDDVKGGSGEPGDDDPGWFFVIKERPGEPRFGLDIERDGSLETWNDLAWPDVFDATADHVLHMGAGTPTLTLTPPDPATAGDYEKTQHAEDAQISWRPTMNAAELAYILYQVPVLVAVHGSEMLPS
ncbi:MULTISPECIES: hypothetical protein [unclassified Streptomyces]|uniref:hypothetical protein n=1 Tax=unclassified Streptomyces TaxID=2593676 RepID=UPI0036692070